ncbi:MAG: FAD-dependent oxidoreductase, partial [Verrucomicrobiota bacterium]
MTRTIKCDFLVAGGGIAGICGALQAGRLGLKTILIEKEMRLGGNTGPNLGVGAHAAMHCNPYWNETGIIEEIEQHINYHRARLFPTNFGYNIHPLWDTLVAALLKQAGVLILRRHLVTGCTVAGQRIARVDVLNIENLDRLEVQIGGFVLDATGDAFVADLAGAQWKMGRESKAETGERSAPERADAIVSTSSITALVVDSGIPCQFTPPPGTPEWNPEKPDNHFDPSKRIRFLWQVDEGGEDERNHPLYTPQDLYLRLVSRIYSVWNYLKNVKFPREAANFQLIWISPILGRRESRRVEGDYLLTETDINNCRVFEDAIAFGGFYLDEHLPSYDGGYEVRYYCRPLPYDIPFRCLYSKNIDNLFSG